MFRVMHKSSLLLAFIMLTTYNITASAGSSDFINDMPQLTYKPDVPGVKTWEKSGLKVSKYTKFSIQPITLFISPRSEYKGINADDMKVISDRLRQALIDALEPDFPVLDRGLGADVMAVRIAVTNLSLKKKKRGLLGYTPIGFVAGSVTKSAGDNVELLDAGLEWELLDGETGERIAVVIERKALQAGQGEGQSNWDAIEFALKAAADRFRDRVERDRAK